MRMTVALLIITIPCTTAIAGDDNDWLAATAATRELYKQMDFFQRSLVSVAGSGRGFYAQFDGIYNDLIYFQQQLKRKVSREALMLAYDKMDGKLHQMLKDLKNFEKWNPDLAMVAARVESADHDLHFALTGGGDAAPAAALRRQILALQTRTENLENMVRYVFAGLDSLRGWNADLAAYRQSLNAFQQMQDGGSKSNLKTQFAQVDQQWQKVVQRVKDMPQGMFVIVQSDAAQVDQALGRVATMLGITGRRPSLVDPLAF